MLKRPRPGCRGDQGFGLVIVMQFVVVAAALGTLVAVAGTYGKHAATQDAAGASAQATTDAGVAEAINYIRSNGLLGLTCAEPLNDAGSWSTATGCTTAGWSDPSAPVVVSGGSTLGATSACVVGQDCFRVWIGILQRYTPAQGAPGGGSYTPPAPGVFRIHSTGLSGNGPGGRSVAVEVKVMPSRFPFGVFANTFAMPASHTPTSNESIFTTGNVSMKCPLTGLDYANNIPAAVHAAGVLTYAGGSCGMPSSSTASCVLGKTTKTPLAPYDQDSQGVSWSGTACANYDSTDPNFTGTHVTPYSGSSFFNSNGLAAFGYQPGGLSPTDYARLKSQAIAEQTYNVTSSTTLAATVASLVSNGVTQPVIYYDNGSGNILDTDPSTVLPSGFFRSPASTSCPPDQAVIVFRGSSATAHWTKTGGSSLAASIFLPDTGGTFNMDGNASIIGTLFADNVQFNGNGVIQLDPCFVANPPGGVLDVTVMNFRSVDTTNVQ